MSNKRLQTNPPLDKEVATFGGGCFWCMEAVFNELKGIEKLKNIGCEILRTKEILKKL